MGSTYKGRHRVNWLFLNFVGLLSVTLEEVTVQPDFLASAVPKLLLVVTRRQKRASLSCETQPKAPLSAGCCAPTYLERPAV